MKHQLLVSGCLVGLLFGAGQARAQFSSVQFQLTGVMYNWQAQAGMPISTTVNPSIGSDGTMPLTNSSVGCILFYPPTTNQFAALECFGAVAAASTNVAKLTNNSYLQGTTAFSTNVALAMQLPLSLAVDPTNNFAGNCLVLRRGQVGLSYFSQVQNYEFGQIIQPPTTDFTGASNVMTGYWRAAPWSQYAGGMYYYSPSAGAVFASQAGQIRITWITSASYTGTNIPAYNNVLAVDGATNFMSFFTNADNSVSLLETVLYVVSTTPVQTPQNMYWTEGDYSTMSHPVVVPTGRVRAVNVIANSLFPLAVASPVPDSTGSTNNLATQTLWYDATHGVIRAYNVAGQVFVELLGSPNGDGTSQFLGFEIVNVAKTAPVNVITNTLGTLLTPYQDPSQGASLTASAINNLGSQYYYQNNNTTYYADQATPSATALQIYWLQTGVAGLQWPYLLNGYMLVWPSDPSQYSFYLRAPAASQAQAALTAVPLDAGEAPSLDYQDPLDQVRGFLTDDKSHYYSWLTNGVPAHRALLRFTASGNVRFERVFSILSQGLQANSLLNGSVVTNLSAWNASNSTLTNFAGNFNAPYVTNWTVNVGDRIAAPPGTFTNSNTGGYWAGYINTNCSASLSWLNPNLGTSYDVNDYVDPLTSGFAAANSGAIIPVNAIPGENVLEVWWFQPDNADPVRGFQPVYWPSVIVDYTIQWPTNAPLIVLANNAGSGPLPGAQSSGSIYFQNDPSLPGYNPNEEHALMLGGQAYALRDDLNITNGTNYSSAPFVLLDYTGDDGRPAMRVFQVLRENPAAGQFFDYIVSAGSLLQAPMPLPLMDPPLIPVASYTTNQNAVATNYAYVNCNQEPAAGHGDLPAGWQSADASGPYSLYPNFTFEDRKHEFWVYRGFNAGLPPLQAGAYDVTNQVFGPLPAATAVLGTNFNYCIHLSRLLDSLAVGCTNLPGGLTLQENVTNGLYISGIPNLAGSYTGTITITDTADNSSVTNTIAITVVTNGPVVALGPLAMACSNQYSGQIEALTNRPPALAQAPAGSNCFTMQFYYKTLPGFAWPGLGNASHWPPAGAVVPYLRPLTNGVFCGDPTSSHTPSLNIVYRPVWPELQNGQPLPTLNVGQTLTTAVNGLPAVRGQDSVQVLYQQSIATNFHGATPSVVLFDPTVQKKASLTNGLPASIVTDLYQGLYFFPNLPPHLLSRFWYDPNSSYVYFTGQFVADPVNGNYVMLNVLRGDDLAAVNGLCPTSDPQYRAWTNAVGSLAVAEFTFTNQYGLYASNPNLTVTNGVGDLVAVTSSDTAADSYALSAAGPGQGYITYVVANGQNPRYAGDPINVYIARVSQPLFRGSLVVANSANASPFSQLTTFEHTADLAGRTSQYVYDWRIAPPVNGQPPAAATVPTWTRLTQTIPGPVYTLGASGIQGLCDNYVAMRYGCLATNHDLVYTNWSDWTTPLLAEGWITRVTQAMDPIAGQTQNLYDNPATTTASIIQLAGTRWDGNVPLNAASLTNNGLIQLYETVLNVGQSLSIDSGINYGPANQALLTAAGYLTDLYMTLGNAAWANSLNPTIGFGTDNSTYGAVATSSFCFEGQEPTLLEQNLALLRGRDDSLSPGVNLPPAYNRLYWNYTYGLDAGQVIYALNYNITDQNADGKVDAKDAQIMFPQGHGDAYGHYLTALVDYYQLLMNPNFDWVPQAQTVLVLGAAVTVNYENETKFASAAAAVARTGRQIFDLTWRENYQPGTANGWGYFATNHVGQNTYVDNRGNTQSITRYWGLDHWAARVGQGAYLNWVVANSLLPYADTNPNDQGVQIVDRQTVAELKELPATAADLQSDMDNANAGFTPLGLPQNAIPFDINPQLVTGSNPQTHFEQIFARAVQALNNAVTAFNAAQNVTVELRQQQNSLSDLQAAVDAQEQAYNDQLIELYGTPYPDDLGPGATYQQGYAGPDLVHYMYVDNVETNYGGLLLDPTQSITYYVDIQNVFATNWYDKVTSDLSFIVPGGGGTTNYGAMNCIAFNIGPDGFLSKPASWTSERSSLGSIQTAAAAANDAQDKYRQACANAVSDKQALDDAIVQFNAQNALNATNLSLQQSNTANQQSVNDFNAAYNTLDKTISLAVQQQNQLISVIQGGTPDTAIVGMAAGGNFAKIFEGAGMGIIFVIESILEAADLGAYIANQATTTVLQNSILANQQTIATNQNNLGILNSEQNLASLESKVQSDLGVISQAQVALNGAQANYRTLVSQGNRIQMERESFRQNTAAKVQGYTVNNAAFLVFQNEDLERYTTLFNLAAQYAYMAAQAYDYETGLLGTSAGQSFLNQIVSSCALGVINNGQPQISGTDTGDPGLANALAEMYTDWQVVKGRLGFNNPDGYGTTVSLRTENYRILAGSDGDSQWKQELENNLVPDLLADSDVKNNCLQLDDGSGQAQPGLVLTFGTTVTDGENLFGQPLGAGDHAFSSSSFATKIYAVGVCLDGYQGMDNPVANSGAGGTSPADPTLDADGLAATPYVYLIPCGADSMRSPPLGDTSTIRTWNVDDAAIPLPFNIGASAFSTTPNYTSADSLSEPLFATRKMQAFRPVSTAAAFTTSIYGANGALAPSQYTNRRLIGRSIWNSRWKLVIPGKTLLNDPNEGLARFINSVTDIHLYFITYSYSGN